MEIVILGHMGRDEALADRLIDHKLHVLGQWQNPGLVGKAEASGGHFHQLSSLKDADKIADLVQAIEPDMFITNSDDALAAGVVDAIKQRVKDRRMSSLLIPCPDQAAARIEWDKFYLRQIIENIDSSFNPRHYRASNIHEVNKAVAHFEDLSEPLVVKPRGLTGGKGVKVQGKHFKTYNQAREYSSQVLSSNLPVGVEIQEKIDDPEFTLQIFTDGKTIVRPPVTYDYPYREDGDIGPGTGGMGTFTMQDGLLPFVNQEDYDTAVSLIHKVLAELKDFDIDYKGVLYPTFFKTAEGLKIVEINARGGDPELINILDLLDDDVNFGEVLKNIANGELEPSSLRFKKLASAMVYLVSPDYGYAENKKAYEFTIKPDAIAGSGCHMRFAASERVSVNRYRTVGSSRTVGLSALGETPWDARQKIQEAIMYGFGSPVRLHYRRQVADKKYIQNMQLE